MQLNHQHLWRLFAGLVAIGAGAGLIVAFATRSYARAATADTEPVQLLSRDAQAGMLGDTRDHRAAAASPVTFLETFDGAPARPLPFRSDMWNATVHSRDRNTWQQLEPMAAHHGSTCGPPSTSHEVTAYEDAVFQCNDHIMTAINARGYGVIYLTPNQMIDFSQGEAIIRFDVSTFRSSARDWIDVWITPYEHNLQLPLNARGPDLQGPPRHAILVRMSDSPGKTEFEAYSIRDWESQKLPQVSGRGYETFLQPDAKRRDTFELRISRTHLSFGMPAYNHTWIDTAIPALDWSQGVVQLGHHSYNPTKASNGKPNTWHWDNVQIAPAIPFTTIPADRRYVDGDTGEPATLSRPAPAQAHLRFAAVGDGIEVSFDSRTWQTARKAGQKYNFRHKFHSYWMPDPEGTTRVWFRDVRTKNGKWQVKDIAVWSR